MEKGKIIFLNGVTSTGKTSIVEAMQNRSDIFFYAMANDLFQDMIGERYLRENYWKYLGDVLMEMYRTAKEFSDRGHHVILDGVLSERPEIPDHYDRMRQILADNRFIWYTLPVPWRFAVSAILHAATEVNFSRMSRQSICRRTSIMRSKLIPPDCHPRHARNSLCDQFSEYKYQKEMPAVSISFFIIRFLSLADDGIPDQNQIIIRTPNSLPHFGQRTVCFPVRRGRHNSALQCGQVR